MTGCFHGGPKKYWWWDCFPIHEIGRIDGRRGFQTGKNVFRISDNKFYDQKNKIPIKILEFKRSGIKLITEFHGIPNRFPNQDHCPTSYLHQYLSDGDVSSTHPVCMHSQKTHEPYERKICSSWGWWCFVKRQKPWLNCVCVPYHTFK